MAITFYNIRSREVRVAETEPMIAAMWGSSDRSPNAQYGQDFGWRLAPEVVVKMKRMRQDPDVIERIARRYKKSEEDITETDFLHYISQQTAIEDAPVAQEADYEDEYMAEIRRLEDADKPKSKVVKIAE